MLHTEASANMHDSRDGNNDCLAQDAISYMPGAQTPRPGSQMQKSKSQVMGKAKRGSNYHMLLNRLYQESKVIELRKLEAIQKKNKQDNKTRAQVNTLKRS